MNLYRKIIFYFLVIVLAGDCKKPYTAPVIEAQNNFLVVDGFLNARAGDTTFIKLTRARSLSNKDPFPAETGAIVNITSDAGDMYNFYESNPGIYEADNLYPDINKKYQLQITTSGSKKYISDFISIKITPPIDSVSWHQKTDGVYFYANTHDAQNNTRYYQWNYGETYVYRSPIASNYLYTDHQIMLRDTTNRVDTCWNSSLSTNIILGSSAKLNDDIIYQDVIQFIPTGDIRLYYEYSILLTQNALTEEGFEFWLTLSKNTEQLGTLFDARPSHVKGNIHSADDPSEPVIGYFSGYTLEQKRIFIHNYELDNWGNIPYPCDSITVSLHADSLEKYFGPGYYIPLAPAYDFSGNVVGYYGAPNNCADCRKGGGVNQKPIFWE